VSGVVGDGEVLCGVGISGEDEGGDELPPCPLPAPVTPRRGQQPSTAHGPAAVDVISCPNVTTFLFQWAHKKLRILAPTSVSKYYLFVVTFDHFQFFLNILHYTVSKILFPNFTESSKFSPSQNKYTSLY
jgi:hypothetical protein